MPYETIVLTDGMAVLFAVPDAPQETGTSKAEPPQSDPMVLMSARPSESRVISSEQARRPHEAA